MLLRRSGGRLRSSTVSLSGNDDNLKGCGKVKGDAYVQKNFQNITGINMNDKQGITDKLNS